ncbi:MAG: ABC transporter permease subunit [Clostridiales bacterium]|nr:ABC transporter permease subunit [Clostridiales bacterium]
MEKKIDKKIILAALKNVAYPIAALAIALAVWAAAAAAVNKPLILPGVSEVLKEFFLLLKEKAFYKGVGWTLLRTLEAFLLSVVLGLAFAVIGALVKPIRKTFEPIATAMRAVPTMAVILLSVLWLDYDEAPVLIGFLICFPLLYSSFLNAFLSVDKDLIEMAKVFKVKKTDTVRYIFIPSILPSALSSMKSVVSLCLKVTIASEVIAQTKTSIGVMMQMASMRFDIAKLMAWTVSAIVLSFVLEGLFALAMYFIGRVRWKSKI